MDASNEILFNSPALHSLKRQQLLILCKKYGVKQSGKNEDLVFRLRECAKGLLDSAQHSATENINGTHDAPGGTTTRSSQQWELVEGDQSHEEENSVLEEKRSRTLSMKSLGALSAKSGSSMGNSLMSIAHSLTRAGSKSSKSSQSRPNSMLLSVAGSIRSSADASMRTTSSAMSTTASQSFVKTPLSHLFPAVPSTLPKPDAHTTTSPLETTDETNSVADATHVPEDLAEESTGLNRPILQSCIDGSTLGNETTVRLVTRSDPNGRQDIEFGGQTKMSRKKAFETPKLRPYHANLAPSEVPPLPQPKPLPTAQEDIGKAFLDMDGRSFTETMKSVATTTTALPDSIYDGTDNDFGTLPIVAVDDCTTPTKTASMASRSTVEAGLAPPSGPFIFGSPAHTVTNAQFGQAAATILDEMNKRLGIESTSSAAAKIGEDGTLNFGEVTPNGRASLIGRGRTNEGRFGRAHEKEFEKMESIVDYHANRRAKSPVKPTASLAGTKRKSTAAFVNDELPSARPPAFGKRIINLDDPKDKSAQPRAPKRQKVDGADLAEMERANAKRTESSSTVAQTDGAAAKRVAATKERRRSSKGRRSSAVGTNGRRKSVAQAKAAPTSRMGLLRGAAKVMKNIISSVSHPTPVPAATTKPSTAASSMPSKAPAAPAKETKPSAPIQKPLAPPPAPTGTSTIAPKAKKPSLPGIQTTRPAIVPRGSSTATSSRPPSAFGNASASSRASSAMSNRTSALSIAPKPTGAQRIVRPSVASTRGKIPNFGEGGEVDLAAVPGLKAQRMPSGSSSVSMASGSSRRSSNMSVSTSTSTSKRATTSRLTSPTIASQARMTNNKAPTASVSSKLTLDSVPETKKKVEKDPDFEPTHDAYDGLEEGGLRPDSPLPEPPASFSSRPLAKRAPLEPTQVENGSLGRKPRISRSKVIAKVHTSREEKKSTVATPAKGRKSVGVALSSKAKMMGGEGGAREKRVSAAADAAKRKTRMSEVAARRRTMAKV